MLSTEARRRLVVVLVGARNPQNIGAAARAMQDFGFGDLRVVNEFAPPFTAARLEATSAVAAQEVMDAAQLFGTLSEAVSDCTYIVGTTAVGERNFHRSILTLQEGAPFILEHLNCGDHVYEASDHKVHENRTRVALLFGSEKTGLTNEQLSFCATLLTISLQAPLTRHLSMNLGQAVAVCLYELTRQGFAGSKALPQVARTVPDYAMRERLFTLLQQAMELAGYSRRFPANSRSEILKPLSMQLGTSREEVQTWMGFLRQVIQQLQAPSPDEG